MANTLEKHGAGQRDDLDTVVARIKAAAPEIRRSGVTSLVLFGSRVRGDARPDSDLDVMIEYDRAGSFTLFDLLDVENLIARATDLKVHVSTRDSYRPDRLERALKHAINVF